MSRVRIESDGTPQGTQVFVDGIPLQGVVGVTWSCGLDGVAHASVLLRGVHIVGEGEGSPQRDDDRVAHEIVKRLVHDMISRSGFDGLWDTIDEDVKVSFVEEWTKSVRIVLREGHGA